MKLESSYPYFPASYVDVVCTAGDRALSSATPAGPNSCLTVGSTEGWRSAIWRVRYQAIPHVDRAISGPRPGRAELQHVNSGFGPGAPGHGPAAHTNHTYHIVGYDARKICWESVAYRIWNVDWKAR